MGLDYMHARYYGGNLGRFMRPDPVPGKLSNPQSFNLYAYVRNNPVNWTDPTGLTVSLGNDWEKAKKAYDAAKKSAGGGAVYLHIAGDAKSGYTLVTSNAQGLAEGGNVGRALSEWIGTNKQTLTIDIGASAEAKGGGGGATQSKAGGDAKISIDPAEIGQTNEKLSSRGLDLRHTMRTVFAHELGHSMYALHPELKQNDYGNVSRTFGQTIWQDLSEEPYAIQFENQIRSADKQRSYYVQPGDYTPAANPYDALLGQ